MNIDPGWNTEQWAAYGQLWLAVGVMIAAVFIALAAVELWDIWRRK